MSKYCPVLPTHSRKELRLSSDIIIPINKPQMNDVLCKW